MRIKKFESYGEFNLYNIIDDCFAELCDLYPVTYDVTAGRKYSRGFNGLPKHSDNPSLYHGHNRSLFIDVKNDFHIIFTNMSYNRFDADYYDHYDRDKIVYTDDFNKVFNSCCKKLLNLTGDKLNIEINNPVNRYVSWSIFLTLK